MSPSVRKSGECFFDVIYTPTAQGTEPGTAQTLKRDLLTCGAEIKLSRRTFYYDKTPYTQFWEMKFNQVVFVLM